MSTIFARVPPPSQSLLDPRPIKKNASIRKTKIDAIALSAFIVPP
jgi:hypothetical protein